MRVNPLYRSLLDKSVGSMLSAIEIYNKPDFNYREESFAILGVNSWELLLKAYLLRLNHFKVNSLYVYKDSKKRTEPYQRERLLHSTVATILVRYQFRKSSAN